MIILAALAGLVWAGYRSLEIQADGMAGKRLGEFAAVAEQIRQDVKRNLDEFMQREQKRPYTDYQHFYVPDNVAAAGGHGEEGIEGHHPEDLAGLQIHPPGDVVLHLQGKIAGDLLGLL